LAFKRFSYNITQALSAVPGRLDLGQRTGSSTEREEPAPASSSYALFSNRASDNQFELYEGKASFSLVESEAQQTNAHRLLQYLHINQLSYRNNRFQLKTSGKLRIM
jgi:hypothetical protein